ncbi:MAG: DNA internalization-related competence protein ComEC/Rec2 [Caldimonas sp.]
MRAPATGTRLAALLLAWLAGVAMQLQERSLLPLAMYVAFAAVASLALAAGFVWRRCRLVGIGSAVVGALVAGFAVTGWQASARLEDALAPALEGTDLVVTGVVASLPQQGPSGLRFRFELDPESRARDGALLPPRIALGWYKGFHEDAALSQPQRELRAGQRWRFSVRLRRPHGNLNPHGFDYELQLFEQGLRATGYVRDAPAPQMLSEAAGFPVERLRQRVRDAIYANVVDRRAAGVLAALAVGDQGAIEREDWDLFRNTGVAHLMSISGLHVTMFAWLAGLGVGALWRRSARATLALPAPIAARWGGLLAATAYAIFSGWGVPSQRTVWMLATVTLLRGAGVRWPWLLVLLAAAAAVTALDPWALTQAGFWLSFMAVGLLMASSPATEAASGEQSPTTPGWRGWPARALAHARADLRTQVIATLGLTPLTLVFFQQVSIVGFLANIVAIPVVTLFITPLALLGTVVSPLWSLGGVAVQTLDLFLATLSSIPGAVWVVPAAPLWAQLAGLAAAALLVLPLPWRARLLALPLALGLLLPPRELPREGSFDLVAADVGQGMAVLVRTRSHVLLFDAGPQYSRESDAGQRVLVPLLRARGDEHIDLLVLSHRDLDHVGGAQAVLGALGVDALSSSLEPGHPILSAARRAGRCEAGQRWTWDGVDFAVLRPTAGDYERALKSNAMSCVIRVSGGGRSALLTGDIEREQEALLVAEHGPALQSDVLIAPHHGSRTSSSAIFLDAVAPKLAVFQAGYRNRFGHPATDVLARYRTRGIAIVASPDCGAWQWSASGPDAGSCERETARHYWHHAAAASEP